MPETVTDLGKKVKAKYPGQYDDLSDIEVGQKVKSKYPKDYGDFADVSHGATGSFPTPSAENPLDVAQKPWLTPTNPLYVPAEGARTAANQLQGVGEGAAQLATGLPSLAVNAATALKDMITGQGTKKAQDLLEGMVKGVTRPVANLTTDTISVVHPSTIASTIPQQREYANLAGQNAAGLLAPEAIEALRGIPRTAADAIKAKIDPSARMAAAGDQRVAIAAARPMDVPTSKTSLVKSGIDAISRAKNTVQATANEALARWVAGAPEPVAGMNFPEPEAQLPDKQIPPRYSIAEANRSIPGYTAPNEAPGAATGAIQAAPPPMPKFIMDDIRAQGEIPKPQLDAPALNKWMGAKASNMMRGADPGARLINEKLVGMDKATTAANVQSALGSAGADLESQLKMADSTGKIINAKSIIDDAIADARKPFAEGTDETFMKKLDQITTDAESQVEDLSKVKPSDAHDLKKTIGRAIDWKTRDSSPFNNTLKKIYRSLNDSIGEVGSDVRTTQLRWQDLSQANDALKESITKDRAGRGTGAKLPTAADALKSRIKR